LDSPAFGAGKLVKVDGARAFVANIYNDVLAPYFYHHAFDDFLFL